MSKDLIKVRLVSFGWSFVSLVVLALAGVLMSSEFRNLLTANFGEGLFTSFLLLVIPELVKHLRNLAEIKKLGGLEDKNIFLI